MPRSVYLSPHFRDFDEIIASGVVAHPDHMRKVANVLVDGCRLGATPLRMRTPYVSEIRLEKLIVAHALVYADLDAGADLESWELDGMPDFTGRIEGRDVALELATVTASGHADAILCELRNAHGDMSAAPDRFVDISLPMVPKPPKIDIQTVVAEIAQLAGDPTIREHEPVNAAAAPSLAALGAHLTVLELTGWPQGYIDVSSEAHSFNPREMYPIALQELADKQRCAERYATTVPLWLVLSMVDSTGVFAQSVTAFAHRRPDIKPFERILVTDGIVLTDSAKWSASDFMN